MLPNIGAFFAIIAALLLVGCGQVAPAGVPVVSTLVPSVAVATAPPVPTVVLDPTAPPAPTAAPRPTALPAATKEPPPAPPAPASDDVLLLYRKSGGIAGINELLTVRADGTLLLETTAGPQGEAQAAPADLARLQQLLASDEFAQLQERYQVNGADFFTYELTLPSATSKRTISTMDTADHPQVLSDVLVLLATLRTQVSGPVR